MNEDDIELGNYGRIARRSWWVLLLGAVFGILFAIIFLPRQNTFFESQISVLLEPGDSDVGQGQDLINEDTEIGIAVSQVIGDRVVTQIEDLDLEEWSENLVISACIDNENVVLNDSCGNQILQFTYQGQTAEQAEAVVLLTADTYLTFRRDREQANRSEQITVLEELAEELDGRFDTVRAELLLTDEESVDFEVLESRLRSVESSRASVIDQLTDLTSGSSDVGSLLGDPSVAESGSRGIPFLLAVIAGAFMGLLLGAMVAIGLDRLDRRVAGADELENDLGVPILGDIPRITQDSPALVTAVSAHTPGAEAFRRVAAAALASRNGGMVNSIAIVGANENEGRTTTTINLALAMAQTGRDVLIVNTDRRNIVVDQIFGLVGEVGLNDYLRTNKDLPAAREAIENASRRVGIRVLSSGTGAEGPLSSSGLESLIKAAAERDMIVIFDTPPALTHAGGLQIAAIADSVLAVAAAGRTRRSELAELRTQLDNVQAYLAGAVFNRTSRLSLLPAGQGDIASVPQVSTVSIPSGVPGNISNGSRNAFAPQQESVQVAPAVAESEVVEAAHVAPAVSESEVVEAAQVAPAVSEPEVVEAAHVAPAVSQPEVFEPAVSQPEVFEPAVSQPEVFEPAVSQPEVFEPAAAEPEVVEAAQVAPVIAERAALEPEIESVQAVTVESVTETNSVSNGSVPTSPADLTSSHNGFEESLLNGASREFVPTAPVVPSGSATQALPDEVQPDVEKFANMRGLFRPESDSDA